MKCTENGRSTIQEFYNGVNIFITGGTGFMGKALTEKLLRSCPDINSIYLLMRSKKGKDIDSRLEEIFDDPLFGPLKQKFPEFKHKVKLVSGDCSLPGLGLNSTDRLMLANEINIVFHGAATVRFDEKMKLAVNINVIGTKSILDLARDMTNLKVIMHVSTAYCNCHLREIEEKFYNYPLTYKELCTLMDSVDEDVIDTITPLLLHEWPNTYAFTKAMAEDVIQTEGVGLPIGVFRPAIVVSTYKEPVSGWIDNIYGPTGFLVGCGIGLIKSQHCHAERNADIVPVDMTINGLIASAWEVGTRFRHQNGDIQVYNFVSSVQNPINWQRIMDECYVFREQYPTLKAVGYVSLTLNKHRFMHLLYVIFLHFIPAFFIDGFSILLGKKPKLVNIYTKLNKFLKVITYFSTNEWKFTNDNLQLLWKKIEEQDKKMFNFNIEELNWKQYMFNYILGARLYLLKEDLSKVSEARANYRRLVWIHHTIKYSIIFLVIWILWIIIRKYFELL